MKVTRFLLSALFLGAMATTASAQGAVSINWDTCIGPVDKAVTPGIGPVQVNASVINHGIGHSGYQVNISLGSGNAGALRDAWRFDATGCQGTPFITMNHLPPALIAKACPAFQGSATSVQIKDYSYDALTGKARGLIANTYPAGIPTSNPATRYFLAGWVFDQTYGVNGASTPGETCGGLEVPVCVHLTKASWLTLDNLEQQWAYGNEFVTSNDPNNSTGCPGATPAVNKTWGEVKAQYKR